MRTGARLAIAAVLLAVAFAQTKPAVELEAAMAKEQVDGDLKAAIAAYQKIAADPAAPREVRAKALLHVGNCYEKLGQEARRVYQQIVRDFADQPAAAQARMRLAAIKAVGHGSLPAAMTERKIDVPWAVGATGTDGQRVVYLDDATGELIYSDIAGRGKRVIFKAKLDDLPVWVPSRDFSKVLLHWHHQPQAVATFAVVNIDGTGYREIARLETPARSLAWSWDSRYVLLSDTQKDGTNRLLKVSVADGGSRDLLNSKATRVGKGVFSPDGRYVAYRQVGTPGVARTWIISAERQEPRLLYEVPEKIAGGSLRILDWTSDGRFLAVVHAPGGKSALELIPVKDGGPAGPPIFIHYGSFREGVTTATGALVYTSVREASASDVHLASVGEDGRLGRWQRLELSGGSATNPSPDWSPDSNQIVYSAADDDVGRFGDRVFVRNLDNGQDREIYRGTGWVSCVWANQHPLLFCSEITTQTGIFSIRSDSGEIERIHSRPSQYVVPALPSHDDRALYLGKDQEKTWIHRLDLATRHETIIEEPGADGFFGIPSADERWLAQFDTRNHLEIRPLSGGAWKPLTTVNVPSPHFNFTRDGNWIFYQDTDSSGKAGLFRIATTGGAPERLGNFPSATKAGSMHISPDGRKVIAVSTNVGGRGYELWSLENFVPAAPKK